MPPYRAPELEVGRRRHSVVRLDVRVFSPNGSRIRSASTRTMQTFRWDAPPRTTFYHAPKSLQPQKSRRRARAACPAHTNGVGLGRGVPNALRRMARCRDRDWADWALYLWRGGNVRERAVLGVPQPTGRARGGIAGVSDGDRRCRDAFRLAACLGPCVVSGSRGVSNSGPHFAASGQKWLSSRCWWHWCGHPVPRIHAQARVAS